MSKLWRVLAAAGRTLLMIGTLLVVWLGVAASAEADVAPTGAFETSVAIKVPPFHGLEPKLELTYSSSGPNGWMGVGWSLRGLSTIGRQSSGRGLPRWEGSDTFTLDGRDLVACPPRGDPSPLADSPSCVHRRAGLSAYTTQVESFQRIAVQGDPFDTTLGDERWVVWRADGVVATYEPGVVTSRGVLEWRLTEAKDLSDNTVRYVWSEAQGEQVSLLQAIRYGDVEIRFQTEGRPDPIRAATGAGLITNATRLQVIDEWAGGQRIRAYGLRYRPNDPAQPARQSFLASVQQYGSDAMVDSNGVAGPTKLPSTTFDSLPHKAAWTSGTAVTVKDWTAGWPTGPDDSTRFAATLDGGPQGRVEWNPGRTRQWVAADLNGDLRTDFASITPSGVLPQFGLQIAFARPDGGYQGLQQPVFWNGATSGVTPQLLVGDVNGDGIGDLMLFETYDSGDKGGNYAMVFGGASIGRWLRQSHDRLAPGAVNPEFKTDVLLGDVTGDGLADLVARVEGGDGPTCGVALRVAVGTGLGRFDPNHTSAVCLPGDLRDGRADRPIRADFQLADVNGDLKADVVGFQPASTKDEHLPTAKISTAIADGAGGFHTYEHDTKQPWAETRTDLPAQPWCDRSPRPLTCTAHMDTEVPAFRFDVDGDGRSDLVVLRPGPHGGVQAWTAFSQGDGSYRGPTAGTTPFSNHGLQRITYCWEPQLGDRLEICKKYDDPPRRWLGGDFDGDGADDLGIVDDTSQTTVSTLRALSDRRGNWTATPESTRDWSTTCRGACWQPEDTWTGDINGDSRDDVLFARPVWDRDAATWIGALDADPTTPTPVAAQVLSGDGNADGRQDLLYPTMTSAGVQVHGFQQRADRSYQRLDPVAIPMRRDLRGRLAQRRWLAVDLDCDRRADLVNLDRKLTVLSRRGQDWQVVYPLFPLDRHDVALPVGGRWSVGDVTGDHCDDLVRVGPGATTANAGVAVISRTVLLNPGRPWLMWSTPAGVPPAVLADTLNWHVTNVDRDTQADLVHVDSRTGQIETLLRRGGGWRRVADQVTTSPTPPSQPGCPAEDSSTIMSTGGADAGWTGLDANADGAIDLARARVDGGGSLLIETLLSHGDGHYSSRTTMLKAADGEPSLPGSGSHHWIPSDLDHDGRGDLLRVFHSGDEAAIHAAVSNGDGCWTLRPTWKPNVAPTLPASSTWRVDDDDGSGQTSALRLDTTTDGLTVSGFDSALPHDTIAKTTNGLGASTSIDYTAGTSMLDADATTPPPCRGPPGAAAILVVAKLTTSDTPTRTADASTIRYDCPRYSSQLRSLVAWRQSWTTHRAAVNRPASTQHVVRDVFPNGIVQPTIDEVTDPSGRRLRATESKYQPANKPEDELRIDLLTWTAVSDCDRRSCATSTVDLTHDEFGNITSELRRAAGSGRQRRTETFYLHDHDRWLHGLARLTRTVDPADPDRLLRASLACYDGDTSPDCDQLPVKPVKPRGLTTLTRAWHDTTSSYVVTGQAGYDQFGNQTSTTNARGHTSTTDFDSQLHLYPIQSCNARRHCTQQPGPWDRRADAPLRVIDPNGAITDHTYDPLGRPATTTRPGTTPESRAVDTFVYRTAPAIGTVTQTTTTAPGVALWSRTFTDGLGRTYLTERPGGAGQQTIQTRTRYSDGSTHIYRTAAPVFKGDSPVWETTDYDATGRPTRHTHADHTAATRRYFIRDGLSAVQERDEAGRTQTRLSDGWGALVRVEQRSVVPGRLATTRYSYNAVDELTAITDPAGNVIRNDIDTLGRKTAEHDPDRGTTRYRYDPAGNLRRQRDARGRVLVYDYDELNRRIRKHDLTTNTTSRWHYDQPQHGASIGRLTSVQDPSAAGCRGSISRDLSYDLRGNLIRETRCVRSTSRTFRSHHDALDRLQTLTYPDGEQLTYTYDRAGRLNGVSGYVRAMAYNAADQLVSVDYANGTRGHWHYSHLRGWLDSQTLASRAGRRLFDIRYPEHEPSGLIKAARSHSNHTAEHYGYDPLGRLTTVTGSWRQQLGYDDLGNLTSNSRLGIYQYPLQRRCTGRGAERACAGPHAVTRVGNSRYQYDATGNMTTALTQPALATVRQYTVKAKQPGKRRDTLWAIAADHLGDPRRWPELFALNKGQPYPRPPGGQFNNPHWIFPGQRLLVPAAVTRPTRSTPATRKLTWNSDGLLTRIDDSRVGRISNLYDADGARVQQTDRTGTTTLYGRLADSTPSTGLTKYVYAGSLLIARHQGTQRRWYSLDRLGSPRLITDQSGRVLDRPNHAPFGQTSSRRGRTGRAEPIGYTGHRPVGETGLIDMLARHYDPKLARMLSADTIIPDLANPQALNRYSYAYNNPITYTDPSGHVPEEKPVAAPDQLPVDWSEFLWLAEQGTTAAASEPTQPTAQVFGVGSREAGPVGREEVPTDTPSATPATTGIASDAATGGSGEAGTDAPQASQADEQTPNTVATAEKTSSTSAKDGTDKSPMTDLDRMEVFVYREQLRKEEFLRMHDKLVLNAANPLTWAPMFTPGQGATGIDIGLLIDVALTADDLSDWLGPVLDYAKAVEGLDSLALKRFSVEKERVTARAQYRVMTEAMNSKGLYWAWQESSHKGDEGLRQWQEVTKALNSLGLYWPWQTPPPQSPPQP